MGSMRENEERIAKVMARLGVNVDHVATLRQARGTCYPSPLEAAMLAVRAGAHGITVHLREDRRHMQEQDVLDLRASLSVPLNLEMAATSAMVDFALGVRPHEVCLVPERREERTTEGGVDVRAGGAELREYIDRLRAAGIIVSIFIEPDPVHIEAARETEVSVVELHTGTYCDAPSERRSTELARLLEGAHCAHAAGLVVHIGHGINANNVSAMRTIPHVQAMNIGHSIVSRAVFVGMGEAVREMLAAMAGCEATSDSVSL